MSKINPSVAITLDKPRHMLLDLNAMVSFEEQTGKNMLNGSISASLSATDLRALLWACLKADDPSLTLEQVGSLITADNMAGIAQALGDTWKNSMPEASKDAGPLVEKPPAG